MAAERVFGTKGQEALTRTPENFGKGFELEDALTRGLEAYLTERRWSTYFCPHCGRKYYSKKEKPGCGNYSCLQEYRFLSLSRKREYTPLNNLVEKTNLFFQTQGYDVVRGHSVTSTLGETLFIVAGVQLLEGVVVGEEPIPPQPFFVAQPVIRMKFLNEVGKTEGMSTSFVNICTEQVNPSVDDHIRNLDSWFEYLSSIGLFVGDMTLAVRNKISNWGSGDFKNIIIDINYEGLHLGDACFLCGIPQKTRENLVVSDIGFGLERICWALNKSQSYFDSIGPLMLSLRNEYKLIDSVRTMVLMASCGVEPSNKAQGYRFRQLSKDMVDISRDISLFDMVPKYYLYWSQFIQLRKTMEECLRVIKREYNRNRNINLANRIGLQTVSDKEPEEFVSSLIQRGIDIQTIRKALQVEA